MEEIWQSKSAEISASRKAEIQSAVKAFFNLLKQDYRELGNKSDIYMTLKRISAIFNTDMDDSYTILATAMNAKVFEYFTRETFMQIDNYSRRCWFRSLMMISDEGLSFLKSSAANAFPDRVFDFDPAWEMIYKSKRKFDEIRKVQMELYKKLRMHDKPDEERNARPQRKCRSDISDNRPLSRYEYQDPVTKMRFYDDPSDGKVVIASTAPPRPSDNCQWHRFRQCWCVNGQPIEVDGQYANGL